MKRQLGIHGRPKGMKGYPPLPSVVYFLSLCVCVRASEQVCVCVCARARVCVRACVRACVHSCVRACMKVFNRKCTTGNKATNYTYGVNRIKGDNQNHWELLYLEKYAIVSLGSVFAT